MIKGWLRYAELSLKAKTGISAASAYCAAIAALALLGALVFLSVTTFIWLAARYGDLIAAAIMAAGYLALAIILAVAAILIRRHTLRRAKRMLAARAAAATLDPGMLALAVQIGRKLGWDKVVPIAVIGFFAAGIMREWSGHPTDSGET